MAEHIRILLVDDDATVRKGLRMRLLLAPDVEVVGEAAEGATAIEMAAELRPDVVLLDISMPGIDGIEACTAISRLSLPTQVLMLSLHDDEPVRDRCRAAGAAAFVGKQEAAQLLLPAIRAIAHGGPIDGS